MILAFRFTLGGYVLKITNCNQYVLCNVEQKWAMTSNSNVILNFNGGRRVRHVCGFSAA